MKEEEHGQLHQTMNDTQLDRIMFGRGITILSWGGLPRILSIYFFYFKIPTLYGALCILPFSCIRVDPIEKE